MGTCTTAEASEGSWAVLCKCTAGETGCRWTPRDRPETGNVARAGPTSSCGGPGY